MSKLPKNDEKSFKNRLPSWVAAILKECPGTPKNSTYYRNVYKPKVPSAGFFTLMLDSLPSDVERKDVVKRHMVSKLNNLLELGIRNEADRQALRMLCRLIQDYLPSGLIVNDGWEDTLLLEDQEDEMRRAVSGYELLERNGIPMSWDFINLKVSALRSMAATIQPTEPEIFDPESHYDESHRLTEWLVVTRRTKLYEMLRNGFDSEFQPTEDALPIFTTLIVQSLWYLLKGQQSPMRKPEMGRYAKMSDRSNITLRQELNENSMEWKMMYQYLKQGGLKNVTMNLAMKLQSRNLAQITDAKSMATKAQWANLLLYRLLGQIPLTKIPPEVAITLSTMYRVPLHQIMLFQYDLSLLIGRRMCYLPNIDKVHAYMELSDPRIADKLDDYTGEYMATYVDNMDRLPSSQRAWTAHFRVLLENAGLDGCKTPLQFITQMLTNNHDMEHLLSNINDVHVSNTLLENDDQFSEKVRKELGELTDEEEDDLLAEEDDAEDSDQIDRINRLLHSSVETLEHDQGEPTEAQPEPEPTSANEVPNHPKPQWDWD